jgi:hypothetical protein
MDSFWTPSLVIKQMPFDGTNAASERPCWAGVTVSKADTELAPDRAYEDVFI